MARGGRRKGSGRKPTGKVAMLVRVSPEIRTRIENDARRARRSLSLEAELALADALRAAPRSDKPTEALCYLIKQITAAGQTFGRTAAPEFDWRGNRFDFEAFRYAVMEVLDRLAPAGDSHKSRYPNAKTPQDMGLLMAMMVLSYLTANRRKMRGLVERTGGRGSLFYAFPQAADALGLRTGEDV
jgi:hypothetical protein